MIGSQQNCEFCCKFGPVQKTDTQSLRIFVDGYTT